MENPYEEHDHGHDSDEEVELMKAAYKPRVKAVRGKLPAFYKDPFAIKDFYPEELRKYLPRLALAGLWYYFCVYVNNVSQAWLQQNMAGFYESRWGYSVDSHLDAQNWLKQNMPDVYEARWGDLLPNQTVVEAKGNQPGVSNRIHKVYGNTTVTLYDLGFLYFPFVNSSAPADTWAGTSAMAGLLRYVVLPGPMSMRWTWLSRLLVVWGALFLCRALTILVTPLPNPYHECVPKITFPHNIFLEAYANLPGVFWHDELTCQDVLFSGHTAMGTVFTLFTVTYMKRSPWCTLILHKSLFSIPTLCDVLAVIWLFYGWYVICASHFHYTVDVMIGAMMTGLTFSSYHGVIKKVWISKHPYMKGVSSLVRWFEWYAYDLRYWRRSMSHNLIVSSHRAISDTSDDEDDYDYDSDEEDVDKDGNDDSNFDL
eukprot:TRINITY_DN16278_c0_g1_i2.p1 TRINITY_DN16278_c0_g1~~TRINITY_DN16278_c0_g1_i2.p1  ORF type:complete len:426 (-),score=23.06 TRINITY_DN16278_c0_g1_i2:344-1621(-)